MMRRPSPNSLVKLCNILRNVLSYAVVDGLVLSCDDDLMYVRFSLK